MRLLCPWDFPGKSTGVGFHFLFQGIFPTQGSNPVSRIAGADALPSELPRKSYRDDHIKTLLEALGCPLAIRKTPAALTECGFPAPQDPQVPLELGLCSQKAWVQIPAWP